MYKKKLGAVILSVILLITMLSACGNSEGTTSDSETQTNETTLVTETGSSAEETSESSTDTVTPGASVYNVTWDDMAEIVVIYPSMSSIPSGLSAVEDAINEITEDEINTHVDLNMIEVGNYEQQLNLMISSGEQIDLMITLPSGTVGFSSMISQKQLTDLTDLLPEYAPTALEGIGELISATQLDGGTYAFPAYRSMASSIYINMRTDVLEDLGLLEKAQNMSTFTEFEEILQAVSDSENWKMLSPIVNNDSNGSILPYSTTLHYADSFSEITDIDDLGSTMVGVIYGDDSSTVVNLYGTDAYYDNYQLVKNWYDNGYVYKDAATSSDMGGDLVKSNVAFSYIAMTEIGAEGATDTTCGTPMTKVAIHNMPVSTSSCTKFTWAVPTTSKEPEAAVTFLEMFFKDSRIANLFAWGIENVDYEIKDDGVAGYIEGNEAPAYHTVEFLNANSFIVTPWTGSEPNLRETQAKYMEDTTLSPYLGFACDTGSVTNEITAVTNAVSEYAAQINSGMADESTFQSFIAKLDSGNISMIIDLYQSELNNWLEKAD